MLTLPALVYSAAPFFRGAWRDIAHVRLGMDVPVALGIGAAFAASAWATFTGTGVVYYDSVTMFIALLLVARYGELVARQKAGAAIEFVARQRPAIAERLRALARSTRRPKPLRPRNSTAGEIVLVRPGAVVPADGEIVDGRSHVEEAMLTGESLPHLRGSGRRRAGRLGQPRRLRWSCAYRRQAKRRDLRRCCGWSSAPRASVPASRGLPIALAAWFVGGLLLLALGTALVWWQFDPARALPVTVALLVVSCPCALSLATPAALAAAAGSLARAGVVLARSNALESLARVTHVVLDKTGTLTEGCIRLATCATTGGTSRAQAIALAAAVDARSEHPLARALQDAAAEAETGATSEPAVSEFRQVTGEGVEGTRGRSARARRPTRLCRDAGGSHARSAAGGRRRRGQSRRAGGAGRRAWLARDCSPLPTRCVRAPRA